MYLKIAGPGLPPEGYAGAMLPTITLGKYREMAAPLELPPEVLAHNKLPVMADGLSCKVTCWGPACAGDGRFLKPAKVEDTRYVDIGECRCEQVHLGTNAAANTAPLPTDPAVPGALPEQPATYTPAKAPVQASDADDWPAFPGEKLPYRGSLDPDPIEVVGPNDHMGGPR